MNAADMRVLSELLEQRTGQSLTPQRADRAESSLRPVLARHGIADVAALTMRLSVHGGEPLARETVDALLNNETSFYRDSEAFRQLALALFAGPRVSDPQRRAFRVWSAGCSFGQEAYSLAMLFADEDSRLEAWVPDIIGTDISAKAIERARRGEFSQFEVQRGLPTRQMLRWFEQDGETWRVGEALRAMVRFRQHNLLDPAPPGYFQLILCRNVLFYFPKKTRREAFDRLTSALAPDGLLMLGAGETVFGHSERLELAPGSSCLYRLKHPAAASRACHG